MGYNEWSDDENVQRGRDKFHHERSLEREEYERYDRKKRGRRSPTPPEDRRHKRRPSYSPPPIRNYHRGRDFRNDPDSDHYNYERDGYRYGKNADPSFVNNSSGYPMMEMMNPQMVNQGWGNNMNRFPVMDPAQLDYLVPFKQFVDFTKRTAGRRVDDDEMQKRYAEYKEKFAARQLTQFFNNNKEKQWFQEKYHPSVSLPRQESMKQRRRTYLAVFLKALEGGDHDQVRFDTITNQATNEDDEPDNTIENSEDDQNAEYDMRLVIKTVPPTIPREKIIEMCQKVDGFEYLALSEPSPTRKFHRIGWINFREGTDIKKAFEQLDNQKVDDFVFHVAMNRKNTSQSRTPRVAPDVANTTERLQKDFEQAKELAIALEAILGDDVQEGLKTVEARAQLVINQGKKESNSDLEEEDTERWALKKRLDFIIAYLRQVHMYCYYCALECDSSEELERRCCEPHCRTISKSTVDESSDPKQAAKNERGAVQWVKNLDQKISLKIHTPDEDELARLGGRLLQAEIDDYVKEHVLKEHESKFKCQVGECSKAFKGFDYVEKHILTKHPEEIERIKTEVEYFNNYVCDPNHILPTSNTNYNTQNMMPIVNMPFVPNSFMMGTPQNMRMGTPMNWDQIPRMSYGDWSNSSRRNRIAPGSAAIMDLENSLPKDPRQVKSYVDLDAPAEGDSNISFY